MRLLFFPPCCSSFWSSVCATSFAASSNAFWSNSGAVSGAGFCSSAVSSCFSWASGVVSSSSSFAGSGSGSSSFAGSGYMDTIEVNQISEFEDQLMETIKKDYANILDNIRTSNTLSDESEDLLKKALDSFLDNFKKNS